MITGRPHIIASGLTVSIDGSGNIVLTDPSNSNSVSLSGNIAPRFLDGILGFEVVGDLNLYSRLLSGTVDPSSATGNNGDYYANTSTGNIFKKQSGAWSVVLTISTGDGGTVDFNMLLDESVILMGGM